ncbi:FadR/GntR family transcriptional regulator [Microbacterium aoyamense]|uniref:FadR/GntR family transcriptional regulator n=1 Tax=Microbacterium aoyamense TaxID=344166 RepID=A0ABN2PCV3_9MICO|nr:FCD domain-containing protein [Microbacterium aoyamense]
MYEPSIVDARGGRIPDTEDPITSQLVDLIVRTGIGGRLPTERNLAEELNVSRTLLRDRLTLLEALGVIQRRSGQGTFVQPLDANRLGNALDIGLQLTDHTTESLQSVRTALERQAAAEAAQRIDRLNVAKMQIAMDVIRESPSNAAVEQADFEFHAALMKASGNSSIVFFADALGVPLRRSFAERRKILERIPHQHELMIELHEAILNAVLAQNPTAAKESVDAHFDRYDAEVAALMLSETQTA